MSSLTGTFWRHKKRQLIYEVITDTASIQCSTSPEFEERYDDEHWIVYRNVKTGAVWVRPTEEFRDGRFEQVETEGG